MEERYVTPKNEKIMGIAMFNTPPIQAKKKKTSIGS